MIELAGIEEAARRLAPHLRHTPVLDIGPLPGGDPGSRLLLKLENLQVTGSFKARGATNKVLTLPTTQVSRGLVTASGGNHGLGVAFAGRLAGVPTTIYLPANVPPAKGVKLERWGAKVVWEGEVWDDANRLAERREPNPWTFLELVVRHLPDVPAIRVHHARHIPGHHTRHSSSPSARNRR